MATEKTYTGAEDSFFNGGSKSSLAMIVGSAALVVGILAMVVALVGWSSTTALNDTITETNGAVAAAKMNAEAFASATVRKINSVEVRLAADATRLTVIETKIVNLESKSVVADLAKELREGKASKYSVDVLRNEILDKADAKTVRRLARRMGKFDTRISNIVELNKLVEVAPAAPATPPERRQATLPAGEAIKAEQARIDAQRSVPAGRPEAPAAKLPPPAK